MKLREIKRETLNLERLFTPFRFFVKSQYWEKDYWEKPKSYSK